MKIFKIIAVIVIMLNTMNGQFLDSLVNETIYLQNRFILSPVIIMNNNKLPYNELESIVSKYSKSYEEYNLYKKSMKSGFFSLGKCVLFGIGSQIILEQMMERNMEDQMIYVGIPLYACTLYEYFKSIISMIRAHNHQLKSIWIYNNEVAKEHCKKNEP